MTKRVYREEFLNRLGCKCSQKAIILIIMITITVFVIASMFSQNEVQKILSQTRNASVPQMLNTLNVKLMC